LAHPRTNGRRREGLRRENPKNRLNLLESLKSAKRHCDLEGRKSHKTRKIFERGTKLKKENSTLGLSRKSRGENDF